MLEVEQFRFPTRFGNDFIVGIVSFYCDKHVGQYCVVYVSWLTVESRCLLVL